MRPPLILLLLLSCIHALGQLIPNIPLPNALFKSNIYEVKIKQNLDYQDSYVIGEPKFITNIKNEVVREAMSDFNHWTTFSFEGKPVSVEVTLKTQSIFSCEIFPNKEKINATISNGKAMFRVTKPNTKLYLLINGDEENPLFIFADPLEKNIPKPNDKGVLYYAKGRHNIGAKFNIPATIHTVYIENGAYLNGSFYAENRSDLTIRGRGIISGDGLDFAENTDGHDKQDNISKSSICLNGKGQNIVIEGITIMRPLKFSVVMRGSGHISNIKCFGWNYTVDGVVTGRYSVVENSFFKVNDDVVKLYSDHIQVRNLVVYHQTNGAVFQLGWSGQHAKNCLVENIEVVKDETVNDSDLKGNHALINWRKSTNTLCENMLFRNINADRGYCRLVGINLSEDSDGSLKNISIENVRLSAQTYPNYARSKTGVIEISMKNITIAGSCIDEKSFLKAGNVVLKNACQ
ncbi:MAG: hypothetical protein R2822_27960 [Spirosomataceae bacterium]